MVWKGSKHSEATKHLLSIGKIGSKNPMFGKKPWNKGMNLTPELRLKLSLAHKNRNYDTLFGTQKSKEIRQKMSESHKNQIPWIKGKHHTVETRLRISEKLNGEKSYLWKGGISFEHYTQEFNRALKEKIRLRDKYNCQECGNIQEQKGRKLYVHHIDYNKKNNLEINLLSLCLKCHAKTNFNREYWTQKYKNLMSIKMQFADAIEILLPYAYNMVEQKTMYQKFIEHKEQYLALEKDDG